AIPGLASALWASITPASPGARDRAAAIFAERCAPCHGAQGDGRGPAAASIEPRPAAFRDPELAELLSPMRAFHAISFGMPGTAMPAHDALLEEERWALAFFVFSFRHGAGGEEGARALERAGIAVPSLEELSLWTDRELEGWLRDRVPPGDVGPALAYLRTGAVGVAGASPFEPMRRRLKDAARAYGADAARAGALVAEAKGLFDGIAGEARGRDPAAAGRAEEALRRLAGAISAGADAGEVRAAARDAAAALTAAEASRAAAPRGGAAAAWLDGARRPIVASLAVALSALALIAARRRLSRARSGPAARRLLIGAALALAGAGAVALALSTRGPSGAPALPGEPFDLTVTIKGPSPATGGLVTLFLGDEQRVERIADNQARFRGLPGAFRGKRVKVVALTEPELEATWMPYDRIALEPPELTLAMTAERPPFRVVVLWRPAEGAPVDARVLDRFGVGSDDVTISAFIQHVITAVNATGAALPGDSEFSALSLAKPRWLDAADTIENLPLDETTLVLVHASARDKKGRDAPGDYVPPAIAALAKR
ncbi:MAG: cytochrome c, partial [Polyangiaceae bacterium]|nr:cytochrome c [Polyangiaceae bacterium]